MAEPTAPPVAEGSSKAAANIGTGLGRKIGPLPLWAWILGVGGLGIVGYLIYQSSQNQGGNPLDQSLLPGALAAGGGSSGTSGTTSTTTTTPVSNASWVATTASSVAASLGLPVNEVTAYLNDFLAGTPPVGSGLASTAYENVITSALQLGGQPPTAPPTSPNGSNPFGSQSAWLTALLQFLPSGTSQTDINNIIALINGSTTTLTQTAANALTAAQNIIGLGPIPINYTIAGTTTAPPGTTGFTVPDVGSIISWWKGAQWWTTANPAGSFVNDIQSAFGLTSAQAWQVWNFTQANQAYFAPGGNEYANLQSVLQQLANGQTLSTTGLINPNPGPTLQHAPVTG